VPAPKPHDVLDRLEPAALRAALALPPRVQRLLAGRPVVREGQTLDVEVQLLLRMQRLTGRDSVEFNPGSRPGIVKDARLVGGHQPIGEVRDLEVDGAEGPLAARLYVPTALQGGTSDPLLVFLHGGGFVTGDLDSHDPSCRFLAERAGVRVLAVDYRLAPESPFPAAPADCASAYRWVVAHAAELGADVERLAVGGDSAGGNLAAVTAITAAREGLPLALQLLVYPCTDFAEKAASRTTFAHGFFLTKEAMDAAHVQYLGDHDPLDPLASPLYADLPDGLAPAYVATAGFDPLRDEGEAFARRLADAGVKVELQRFPSMIHGFLNMVGAGRSCPAAMREVAERLSAL
jgi:acetyl esterase